MTYKEKSITPITITMLMIFVIRVHSHIALAVSFPSIPILPMLSTGFISEKTFDLSCTLGIRSPNLLDQSPDWSLGATSAYGDDVIICSLVSRVGDQCPSSLSFLYLLVVMVMASGMFQWKLKA